MHDVHVLVIQEGRMQALSTKSTKDASSLKCEQCNKVFSRSWLLKNHQRVHTGERPYRCAFCDKAFADKSNLRQHQKIHTTTEKLFQCGICQRTFAQRRYLMKHATEIHRDVTMSLYGSTTTAEKMEKEPEPVKEVEKPTAKISAAAAVQTTQEVPNKAANHQYLTRQKSHTKSGLEPKDEKEPKDKKYSEQDLKDFIKSNHKMMEKNGYIFIKQNFESLDTEPTLTEISEVPVTAVPDEVGLKIDSDTGNQILNVNGKMVYLQMENKPLTAGALAQKVGNNSAVESQNPSGNSNLLKGRKLVAKKDSGVRRHANILKTGSAKKVHNNTSPVKLINVGNSVNIKQISPSPVHLLPNVSQGTGPVPVTLMQVMPQGAVPVVQSQGPFVIPLTLVQMPQQLPPPPLMSTPTLSNLKTVSLPKINTVTVNSTNISHTNIVQTVESPQQVIEIQTVPMGVDEKGAASDVSGSTPIVSDAPWQGIVNINSEQELIDYISSNTQGVSAIENDQGMTILIQNVESQNGSVMSLDSQNLLSGSGHFSTVFSDQATIISDVLPESGNIHEVQINSEDIVSNNSNQNSEIKEEASNDSDDAQSQVMLTEANREHLSDTEDFTQEHDKLLTKTDECEAEVFSDHTMYTSSEVKTEIDEKASEMMDTEVYQSESIAAENQSTEGTQDISETGIKENE